jgi:hypothetical protein
METAAPSTVPPSAHTEVLQRTHSSQPVEATEHRMRQIMLTAAAATLALIPISHEIFWGPMAYAMMGGIVLGTALTLLCDLCGGDRPADQWAIFWIDAFS